MEMVDWSLAATQAIICLLKFHIQREHWRMESLAEKHRSERSFEVRDQVYLKLQPYKQVSITVRPYNKLSAKYYGSYPIVAKVGVVAYKLLLPVDSLIYHTFYTFQLKRCHEVTPVINHPHVFHLSNPYYPLPEDVLERRMMRRGNEVVAQALIKQTDIDANQVTWKFLTDVQHRLPSFQP